jgi:hypothetical protein
MTCPAGVVRILHNARVDLSNEKNAQAEIETLFAAAGIAFDREKRLSARDIPDFFLPEIGLAVEVKLAGARKMEVFKQLQRYARHEEVVSILLATSMSMGLPQEIEGKPAYYASLGRGWL